MQQFTADHRYLLDIIARQAGFARPVAINLDVLRRPLLKAATKGELLPLEGVLVRDWNPHRDRSDPGMQLGLRLYTIEGVRFVQAQFQFYNQLNGWGFYFTAVDRKDYTRLYRIALRLWRHTEQASSPPVLPPEQLDLLWKNTIGYLEPGQLQKIQAYGGRPRRGVLLTGPPGNGKTMACRWVLEECKRRGWEFHLVTPDSYRQARANNSVEDLFSVERCGVVFFDDMDLALRDRETVHETEDQSVFLSALDGITPNEGVVFIFTTNCPLDLIDRAFKRPGRIDVALQFEPPDAALRRQLFDRWHEEIRQHVEVEALVDSTEGRSFADLEELKNLLVMRFMETGQWQWDWALRQFDVNRCELTSWPQRHVGFAALVNGEANGD